MTSYLKHINQRKPKNAHSEPCNVIDFGTTYVNSDMITYTRTAKQLQSTSLKYILHKCIIRLTA